MSEDTINNEHETFNVKEPTSDIKEPTNDIKEPTSDISNLTTDIKEPISDIVNLTNNVKELSNKIDIVDGTVNSIESKEQKNNICEIDQAIGLLIYNCPHCSLPITTAIGELACCIFRHGSNMKTNQQVQPHAPKEECDRFAQDPDYVGCCKPYKIVPDSGKYTVEICDYI